MYSRMAWGEMAKACYPNLSVLLASIENSNEFDRIFYKGDSLDITYLDFSKAYDKVPHQRLIKKLEGYVIQVNVLRWIAERLEDWKQRVQLNGNRAGGTEVRSGVP